MFVWIEIVLGELWVFVDYCFFVQGVDVWVGSYGIIIVFCCEVVEDQGDGYYVLDVVVVIGVIGQWFGFVDDVMICFLGFDYYFVDLF